MERRDFIRTCGTCGMSAVLARNLSGQDLPERLPRPQVNTQEGGLWAMFDREE